MRSLITLLLLCSVPTFAAGCNIMGTMQGAVSKTVSAFKPTSFDGWDPGSETSDPWVNKTGEEARGNRPMEKEADPLGLRNLLMSNKARDIERNLGVE